MRPEARVNGNFFNSEKKMRIGFYKASRHKAYLKFSFAIGYL